MTRTQTIKLLVALGIINQVLCIVFMIAIILGCLDYTAYPKFSQTAILGSILITIVCFRGASKLEKD